jgi:hypothetical protein
MNKLSSVSRIFYDTFGDGITGQVGYIDVTPFSKIPDHFNELYSDSVKDLLIGDVSKYNKNKENKGYIELNSQYLNDNGNYLDDDQVTIILDYPKEAPIYDVIMTIFEKLTHDHRYKLDEIKFDETQQKYVLKCMEYKDLIYCPDEFVKLHPEIKDHLIDDHYLPFTPENSKYLDDYTTVEYEFTPYSDCISHATYDTEDDIVTPDHIVLIFGSVSYNKEGILEFIYDYPIIGKGMSKEYYDITRGRIVYDVELDEKTNTYYIDPYDTTIMQKRVDELNQGLSGPN